MTNHPGNTCGVYGDYRLAKLGAEVTLVIDGTPHTIKVCDYHQAFFEDFDYSAYMVGLTYTGQIEIRELPPSVYVPPVPPMDIRDCYQGTLFLKASVVDVVADQESWGVGISLVHDEVMQGNTPVPTWAVDLAELGWKFGAGSYITQFACKGSTSYDVLPERVWPAIYVPVNLGSAYIGWDSQGQESVPAFDPELTNDLIFAVDHSNFIGVAEDTILEGLLGDNYGDLTGNPRVSFEARLALTKFGASRPYTEEDLS